MSNFPKFQVENRKKKQEKFSSDSIPHSNRRVSMSTIWISAFLAFCFFFGILFILNIFLFYMCTKYLMIEISIFNKNYNCKKFYKEILIKFQIISCEKVLNYNKILQFLYKNVLFVFFLFLMLVKIKYWNIPF